MYNSTYFLFFPKLPGNLQLAQSSSLLTRHPGLLVTATPFQLVFILYANNFIISLHTVFDFANLFNYTLELRGIYTNLISGNGEVSLSSQGINQRGVTSPPQHLKNLSSTFQRSLILTKGGSNPNNSREKYKGQIIVHIDILFGTPSI